MAVHAPALSSEQFRDAIGHFATGVTVITTQHDEQRHGTTASAVSSLSLEPPMLLVCLNKTSATGAAIAATQAFAVNVLAHGQDELAKRFAIKHPDRFAGVAVADGHTGVPLLADALAHFECRVAEQVTGGTHVVFIAEVHAARTREGVAPLAYFRGQFGRLELAQDAESYARLRERLLDRALPIGERLDPDGLAEELGLSPKSVRRSLARLGGEGLVERDDTGGFFVEPLTFARVEDAFRARLAIQLGAAALTIGRLDAAQLRELRVLMERTCERLTLDEWLAANSRFHERAIELAGSAELLDSYRRLTVPGIMSRSLLSGEQGGPELADDHVALMDAYERSDLEAARAALVRDTERAIELHRDRLEAVGGAI
jgi:4-nitrophenol 2-monooxygenase / 4-nitrocatechol 4-monooxygenase, reductase component